MTKTAQLFIRYVWILLFSTGASTLYAQYENLLHKSYSERLPILLNFYHNDLLVGDSVTLFTKIHQIRKLAEDNGDDDLLMETSLMRAHYFYYRDKKFPRTVVLAVIDSLKTESIQRKKIWCEILADNIAALYNFQNKYYQLAFEHHQRVFDLVKDLSPKEFPHKQNCLSQIADEYYLFNDFTEAIYYNKLALDAEPPYQLHPFTWSIGIMNTTGLCYQQINNLDSADHYFRKTYAAAVAERSRPWEGISSGNLGYDFFLRNDYEKATPLIEKDLAIAVETSDWGLASNALMTLGHISLLKHDIAKAHTQLSSAQQYAYQSGQYKRLLRLYPLLAKLNTAEGKTTLAAMYMDSSLFVKDSIARQLNALQLLRARQKVDLERYRAGTDRIENQRKRNIWERDILIAVVILMMSLAIYIFKENRKKYHRQQEQVRKAEEELLAATRQLNDFAKNISEKNTLIEILQQQSQPPDNDLLQQLQQSTILTDADWEYFRNLFDKVHAGFLQRLKEKLPGLTPAETRFMALSKLHLSNKEMAAMLGVGSDAIRQYRSRLRKKLNLNEEGSIEEMVNSI